MVHAHGQGVVDHVHVLVGVLDAEPILRGLAARADGLARGQLVPDIEVRGGLGGSCHQGRVEGEGQVHGLAELGADAAGQEDRVEGAQGIDGVARGLRPRGLQCPRRLGQHPGAGRGVARHAPQGRGRGGRAARPARGLARFPHVHVDFQLGLGHPGVDRGVGGGVAVGVIGVHARALVDGPGREFGVEALVLAVVLVLVLELDRASLHVGDLLRGRGLEVGDEVEDAPPLPVVVGEIEVIAGVGVHGREVGVELEAEDLLAVGGAVDGGQLLPVLAQPLVGAQELSGPVGAVEELAGGSDRGLRQHQGQVVVGGGLVSQGLGAVDLDLELAVADALGHGRAGRSRAAVGEIDGLLRLAGAEAHGLAFVGEGQIVPFGRQEHQVVVHAGLKAGDRVAGDGLGRGVGLHRAQHELGEGPVRGGDAADLAVAGRLARGQEDAAGDHGAASEADEVAR